MELLNPMSTPTTESHSLLELNWAELDRLEYLAREAEQQRLTGKKGLAGEALPPTLRIVLSH